jgi:UDP-N-acetylmuramate--alanine ligase
MSHKTGIAITGAHGKTTTSALISHIFLSLQLHPTCLIGGIIPFINSNAFYGDGKFFITEADESDRSFVLLPAAIKVITNIDFEHVETYNSIDDIKETCLTFLHAFQEQTIAHVLCIDDKPIQSLLPHIRVPYKTYGTDQRADLHITNIRLFSFSSHFVVYCKQSNQSMNCVLPMPGIHNVLNAAGALCTAHIAGIDLAQSASALSTFKGVERRFTIRGRYNNALVIDDYAHHPEEIRKALITAKQCIVGKLYVIYQPHRFTRTVGLWSDFVDLWQKNDDIEHLFITDIYGAGEKVTVSVSSSQLVTAINKKNCGYIKNDISTIKNTLNLLQLCSDDLILFLGAGDISLQSINLTQNPLFLGYHTDYQKR